ncbi:hypothetical protein [Tropicibacter sp. S64]|uniref:hypothetical protein n=1 Tax=Tropicibacter sp. S64 TaxID=3415122 RepID=UPI003C7B9DC7
MTFRSAMEKAAWDKVSGLAEFHWSDLAAKGVAASTAETFIRRWHDAGLVREVRKEGHRKLYTNAQSAIPVTPQRRAGATAEGNMWRSMRKLPNFTPIDLVAHSNAGGVEVSMEKARRYCRDLLQAGYLRVIETAIPRQREARYRLIRDTGPVAPKRTKLTGIDDPNTGEFQPERRRG